VKVAGNPYRRIFELDERIGNSNSLKELTDIYNYVWFKNRKFSLATRRMITTWIVDRKATLQDKPNYLLGKEVS
jgi:hypothetical protein